MAAAGTIKFTDSESITTESSDFSCRNFAEETLLQTSKVAVVGVGTISSGFSGYTFDVLLCDKFKTLAERWKAETIHISSLSDIESHSAYQEIISMGQAVVPLILWELVIDPDWWFMALDSLVDTPPPLEGDDGDLMRLSAKWVDWGESNGYLPSTQ